MRRREFVAFLGGVAIMRPLVGQAQQAGSIPTVGFVYTGPEDVATERSSHLLDGLQAKAFASQNKSVS